MVTMGLQKVVKMEALFGAPLSPFLSIIFCWHPIHVIGSAFKTSLSSDSFATKQLRVSQVTPITLHNGLKVKS